MEHLRSIRVKPSKAPYGVLAGALALTLAGTVAFHHSARELDEERFTWLTAEIEQRVQERLDANVSMLLGARGLFATTAEEEVDRETFKRYVSTLELADRYPGVRSLGFSRRLMSRERTEFERRMQSEAFSDFSIWPAGEREELHTIAFIEPLDGPNRTAIGFDMRTDPNRAAAMDRARDEGRPIATGAVTFTPLEGSTAQRGVLIYVPVYRGAPPDERATRREALLGFVFSPLRIDELLHGTLGRSREPQASFELFDGSPADPLAQLSTVGAPPERGSQFIATRAISFAGRPWSLVFHSTPSFEQRSRLPFLPYVALSGLIASLGAFALSRSRAKGRARAVQAEQVRTTLLERAVLARAGAEESERRFRFLAESVPHLVFTVTADGKHLTYCNERFARYTGRDRERLLHEGWSQLVHPSDRDSTERRWRKAVRCGASFESVFRLRHAEDGTFRWFISRAAPRRDAEGCVVAWFGTCTDIDAQKQTEASLLMQSQVLQSMSEGVTVTSEDGFIVFANPAAEQMFGFSAGTLVGVHASTLSAVPSDAYLRRNVELIAALRSEGVWTGEWQNRRKDGTSFDTLVRIRGIDTGAQTLWVNVQEDITERKREREERDRLFSELQQAVRVRDDFLSVAGHELRTPLAVISLQIDALKRLASNGQLGEVMGTSDVRLQRLGGNVGRLTVLVRDLLDVSKITSGRLALLFEPVDLAGLVEEVLARFVEPLERARCTASLVVDGPVTGLWDRSRLDQVLTNLLSNAVKYGQGRPIEVRIGRPKDGVAQLSVRDYGIGIQPEHRGRVFGRFERAVSDRNYGGLGLGLWISREIVASLGGHIDFSCPTEGGTCFTVELPLTQGAVAESAVADARRGCA